MIFLHTEKEPVHDYVRQAPTHKAVGRDFFVASKQRFHVSPVCEAVGDVLSRRTATR